MKQRGFTLIEIAIVIGAVVALVAAVAGAIAALNAFEKNIRDAADKGGYDRALKEVAVRDSKELADARQKIIDLTARVRALEKDLLAKTGKIAALLEEKRKRSQSDEDTALRGLDDVGHVLRDGIVLTTPCPKPDGAGPGAPSAAPAGIAAAKTCYRFNAASERFLLGLARETRDNAEQVSSLVDAYDAAQAAVNAWRP